MIIDQNETEKRLSESTTETNSSVKEETTAPTDNQKEEQTEGERTDTPTEEAASDRESEKEGPLKLEKMITEGQKKNIAESGHTIIPLETKMEENKMEKMQPGTPTPIKKKLSIFSKRKGTKEDIHETTAQKLKESLSTRTQEAPRTYLGGYKSTYTGQRPTRVIHMPKKFDDYHMGSITTGKNDENTSSDEDLDGEEEVEAKIRKRGIRSYINKIRSENEEEMDMETLHERKEILMTEFQYILDTLLMKETDRRTRTGGKTPEKEKF